MNIWDIVITLIVAFAVGAAVRRMIINRKNGRSSCGCGCGGCNHKDICNRKHDSE